MSFLIVNALTPECTDEKRLSVRDEHLAYGKRNRDLVRLSSRTFSSDGETLTGGFFVLRTDDYAQAKKFYEWALTPQAQTFGALTKQYQLPSNKDTPVDPNVPDFKKIKMINYDYAKYGESSERKRLIARWEKEVGSLPH